MPLTEKELKQIREEALEKFPVKPETVGWIIIDSYEPMREVYIAAVTSEREKAKGLLDALQKSFSKYVKTEGCSCCQDVVPHSIAAAEIGELLGFEKYKDGSGYNFYELPNQYNNEQ